MQLRSLQAKRLRNRRIRTSTGQQSISALTDTPPTLKRLQVRVCLWAKMVSILTGRYKYAQKDSLILKRIVQFALDKLLGEEITLKTNLGAQGVTTVMEQKCQKRYINHLLYAAPVKRGADVEIIEGIVPVYGIDVTLKLQEAIKKVYLALQKTPLPFTCADGKVAFTVEKIDCYQMVVLEY